MSTQKKRLQASAQVVANLALIAMIVITCNFQAHAATYYISPQGKDSNNGLTEKTAFATPWKINSVAKAGDTFLLMDGTYTNPEPDAVVMALTCAGTNRKWITIKAAPGHRPHLKSSGKDVIYMGPTAAYIEISDLDIEGNSSSVKLEDALKQAREAIPQAEFNGGGIAIDGRSDGERHPHHIRISNNRVFNCSGGGIVVIQADYVTIENNVVYGTSWYARYGTSAISLWQSWNYDTRPGYHMIIRNNRCFGNRSYVPTNLAWLPDEGRITDGNAIIVDDTRNTQGGSRLGRYKNRTLIEDNVCFNNGGSGIHAFQSDHVDILNNVVSMNCLTPEIDGGQIHAYDASDVRIEGNTFAAPRGKNLNGQWSQTSGIVWKNNVYFGGKPNIAGEGDVVIPDLPPVPFDPEVQAPLASSKKSAM